MNENVEEKVENIEKEYEIINSFDKMGLKENLLRGIYSYGFELPSLIQSKSIPLIIKGKDLIAQSHSGTGKTGAFTIGTKLVITLSLTNLFNLRATESLLMPVFFSIIVFSSNLGGINYTFIFFK